jgi:hypothetical protein
MAVITLIDLDAALAHFLCRIHNQYVVALFRLLFFKRTKRSWTSQKQFGCKNAELSAGPQPKFLLDLIKIQ